MFKNILYGVLITMGLFAFLMGVAFGTGAFEVLYTKTIGKAKQNAQREVFEETQSYVEGKRQEALKLFKEYNEADEEGKEAIEYMVSSQFANFDESHLRGPVRNFVEKCKYE